MRRHHFLGLHKLEGPTTGAQAEYKIPERQARSMQPRADDEVYRRLPHLFTGAAPRSNPDVEGDGSDSEETVEYDVSDGEETAEDVERRENSLGRVQSYSRKMAAHTRYSRKMAAHTQYQLDSPGTRTLPGYTKTMYAFTLNQLGHHQTASRSEMSSPQLGVGGRQMLLPMRVCSGLSKLSLDEPLAPVNTPEVGHSDVEVLGKESQVMRRRSLTEPLPVPRDFVEEALKARVTLDRTHTETCDVALPIWGRDVSIV